MTDDQIQDNTLNEMTFGSFTPEKIAEESADAYNNRGYAYFQQEDYDKASQDYNSAIEIKPDNVLFYNNRSMLLLRRQEWENAKSDLTKLKNMGQDISVLW